MKIKDESKKYIVDAYQKQVQEGIDHILGLEAKLSTLKKEYVKNLEENIRLAPFILGYMSEIEEKSENPKKKK